jgi:hypothetical protein
LDRLVGRKLLWAYALLMIVAALGYAKYDTYMMDGDGTAFLDIAQDLRTHHAALAINGYWNPGYPAVLSVAERLTHPGLWRELTVVRYANVAIFIVAMAATFFFTTGLARARRQFAFEEEMAAVGPAALHLFGLGLLVLSMGRELPIAAPRSDTLLMALLLLAGGVVLRLLVTPALTLFAALGLTLGAAYLTKSFAFLPSAALLAACAVYGLSNRLERTRWLTGSVLAAALFALTAGPYLLAISRQVGHFTTGESARLNYAFFIDMTPRWHEWYHHDLGHAGGTFVHPEAVLAAPPPVFSYAAHPIGTFPLWFDPAWWTLGLKPHVWVKGHVYRLARNVVVSFRYLLGRPEPFVLLAVLLACGAGLRRSAAGPRKLGPYLWAAVPIVWGALMFAIYLPIDLQDRYLTAPFFLVLLPAFALLRSGTAKASQSPAPSVEGWSLRTVAAALILLFAGTNLLQAATYLADRRRHTPPAEQRHPGYDPQIFTAAAALDKLGLRPEDKVACMGDLACYTDFYWARLAGTQILGEVETPGEANPLTVWASIANKSTVTQPLADKGLRYIVSLFPNSGPKPAGWIQLGESNFFAYPLEGQATPAEAAAIASFRPNP